MIGPTGDTLRGPGGVATVLGELGNRRPLGLRPRAEHSELCVDGVSEMGAYQVAIASPTAPLITKAGRYAVHWVVSGPEARIDRLVMTDAPTPTLRDVSCQPYVRVADRSVVVFMMPMSGVVLGQTAAQMKTAAAEHGWVSIADPSSLSRKAGKRAADPLTRPLDLTLGGRIRWGSWWLEAATQLMGDAAGAQYFNDDVQSLVTTTATSRQTYGLMTLQRGAARVGAGPVLVRTSWQSGEELIGVQYAPPTYPDLAERSRTTQAVGAIAHTSYAIDIMGGNVLDVIAQYRMMPSVHSGALTLFPGGRISQNALIVGATVGHAF